MRVWTQSRKENNDNNNKNNAKIMKKFDMVVLVY